MQTELKVIFDITNDTHQLTKFLTEINCRIHNNVLIEDTEEAQIHYVNVSISINNEHDNETFLTLTFLTLNKKYHDGLSITKVLDAIKTVQEEEDIKLNM